MRSIVSMAFSTGLASAAIVGASAVGLNGKSDVDRTPPAIDRQINVLNGVFGTPNAAPRANIAPFQDVSITDMVAPDLPAPLMEQLADPITDPEQNEVPLPRIREPQDESGDIRLPARGGAPTGLSRFVPGDPSKLVRFGGSPSVLGSGGLAGESDTGAFGIAAVPHLFDAENDPSTSSKQPLVALRSDQIAPVPVPGSLLLFGTALVGLGMMRRRARS